MVNNNNDYNDNNNSKTPVFMFAKLCIKFSIYLFQILKGKLLKEAIQQFLLVKSDVNMKCLYKRYSYEDEKTSVINITAEQ